jgi:hypothetical protein
MTTRRTKLLGDHPLLQMRLETGETTNSPLSIEIFEDLMKTTGSDQGTIPGTPRATKFSLAANYDPELVPQLAGYPVDEVYGKFPTDGVSGGRPRYLAAPLSASALSRTRPCLLSKTDPPLM